MFIQDRLGVGVRNKLLLQHEYTSLERSLSFHHGDAAGNSPLDTQRWRSSLTTALSTFQGRFFKGANRLWVCPLGLKNSFVCLL